MDVDWVVGIMFFLVFVAWSFAYFSGIVAYPGSQDGDSIHRQLMGLLTAEAATVPLSYSSATLLEDQEFYMDWDFPYDESTVRMEIPCEISDSKIYMLANVSGSFQSDMEFSDSGTTSCTADIENQSDAIHITTGLMEERTVVLESKIQDLFSTDYETLKESLGADFRITFQRDSGTLQYPMENREGESAVVREYRSTIWETGENVSIRILVW